MATATINTEIRTLAQATALRARANANRIDLVAASRYYCHALPDMLSVRAASQLLDYLNSEDCQKRFAIKPQSRCPACRQPLSQCECGGSVN